MPRRLHTTRRRILAAAAVLVLAAATGCSSLPRGPRPDTELNRRTASLHELGRKHFQAGRLDKAGACFDEALAVHARVDDRPGVAVSLLSKGRVHLAAGETDLATASFEQAEVWASELRRADLEAQALIGRAAVLATLDDPAAAIEILGRARGLPLAPDARERAVLLHDLGAAELRRGDVPVALEHLRESVRIHRENGDLQGLATTHYSLALAHDAGGDRDAALQAARRALALDKTLHNERGVRQDLRLLAALHEKYGDRDQAEIYLRRARLAGG